MAMTTDGKKIDISVFPDSDKRRNVLTEFDDIYLIKKIDEIE